MVEPFKNLLNAGLVRDAAGHLARHAPGFDADAFVRRATRGLDALEMKARAMQIADALEAALPSASNVSLLAERYGADNGRIARIIMSSTVLAFASFSLLAWAFGIRSS